MKKFFVTVLYLAFLLVILNGCLFGSYRGIRVADKGKWEFTPHVGYPFDLAGIKITNGIFERSEIDIGSYLSTGAIGVSAGGKYLILDEKTSNDFMSLAISGRSGIATASSVSFINTFNIDLELIGGVTFGEYTEESLPGNIYLGLGPRYFPFGDPFSGGRIVERIFIGGEIPFGTTFILTPEVSIIPRILIVPNLGIGLTIRP